MKILKILGGDDYGGQYICEIQFIKYWKSKGVIVDAIIIGEGRALDSYTDLVDHYILLPNLDARMGGGLKVVINGIIENFRYVKQHIKSLKAKIVDHSYDAIIFRSQVFIFIASYLGKKGKIKTFWHFPNSINRLLGKVYYNLLLPFLKVIPVANSVYTKKSIGPMCKYVIYPGFDENRVEKTSINFKNRLNICGNSTVFGIAARVHPSKAQDLIIKAFKKNKLNEKGGHLLIAGTIADNGYYEYCKELCSGFEANIHFLGQLQNISPFYNSLDVYINSRIDAEPFGISIAEAMGAGLPIIAYFKGGPSEMVKVGYNGWLVKTPNVTSYSIAMDDAISDKFRLKTFGRNSIDRVKPFSSDTNAERFLKIIESENQ